MIELSTRKLTAEESEQLLSHVAVGFDFRWWTLGLLAAGVIVFLCGGALGTLMYLWPGSSKPEVDLLAVYGIIWFGGALVALYVLIRLDGEGREHQRKLRIEVVECIRANRIGVCIITFEDAWSVVVNEEPVRDLEDLSTPIDASDGDLILRADDEHYFHVIKKPKPGFLYEMELVGDKVEESEWPTKRFECEWLIGSRFALSIRWFGERINATKTMRRSEIPKALPLPNGVMDLPVRFESEDDLDSENSPTND